MIFIFAKINIMKLLYNSLGKDVTNIILDYCYKPDIKRLNNEYHEKFELVIGQLTKFLYDFIRYKSTGVFINNTYSKHRDVIFNFKILSGYVTRLPKKYAYSSGKNNISRFK